MTKRAGNIVGTALVLLLDAQAARRYLWVAIP
jgi:hypothetical protein